MKEGRGSQEYIQNQGELHQALEWPRGFPKEPLEEESTTLWQELNPEYEYSYCILKTVVEQMCQLVSQVGQMESS